MHLTKHISAAVLVLLAVLAIVPMVRGTEPAPSCREVTVLEDWDVSGSGDLQVIETLRREIQTQVVSHPCVASIKVRGFATARDVLSVPFVEKRVPRKEVFDETSVCGPKTFQYRMYDDARKQYEKDCQVKRDAFTAREARKRNAVLESVAGEVRKLNFKQKSPQSCIYQSIGRALSEPPSAKPIIVTDLKEECLGYPGPIQPLFGVRGGARPIVVVIPTSKDADPIAEMDKRMGELRGHAPGVAIIPFNRIETLGSVLREKEKSR